MPAPGTSVKMPQIMKTCAGQRVGTAEKRDRRHTTRAAASEAIGAVSPPRRTTNR